MLFVTCLSSSNGYDFLRTMDINRGHSMEIFLGAETEGPATRKWFDLQKEFSVLLAEIKDEDYGDSLTSIGIISIIMHPEYFDGDGYKERKYYSRKKKEADIRLRINYTDFVNASKETRKGIYISHILEAITIAGNKAGDGFDLSRLLLDVKRLLK